MNNKGFAITTILYGTLILFLMLLISLLGILSAYKDRLSLLTDSNNGARDIINDNYNMVYEPPTCTLSASDMTITATVSNTRELVYYGWDSSYSGDNSTTTTIGEVGTYTYYVKDTAGNVGSCGATVSEINVEYSCIGVYHSTYGRCVAENETGLHCYVSSGLCLYWRGTEEAAYTVGNANAVYSCPTGFTQLNDNYCFVSE